MKEFMIFILKPKDSTEVLSAETHQKFLKACEIYIDKLKNSGKLVSAQPIDRLGKIISGKPGKWKEVSLNGEKEVVGGYYHIIANDLDEAIDIAKQNPEFEYNDDTRVEVRPIKMKEESTGFVYPSLFD